MTYSNPNHIIHGWKSRHLDFVFALTSKAPYSVCSRDFGWWEKSTDPSIATTEELLCIETSRQSMKHAIVTSSIGTLLQTIKNDLGLYYIIGLIMLIYKNDCITTAKSLANLVKMIVNLASTFEITDEGDVDEYLGVEMK